MERLDSTVVDLSRATWQKSSRSGNTGGNCVEVALNLSEAVAVRDSKRPDGPALVCSPAAWRSFKSVVGHHPIAL
ncbi:DUF397 domain-containing protein [Sphaerisporangium rhizosphaerae]|uniref:DUF397 domain-containing protein n=1 Tax=Sphaerisporangium rhizosphaerae TaxID=2269375 RepID=A0ABW2PDQ0_9ACTN